MGLRVSKAFDVYWHLAAERQLVFYRRLRGDPAPWTHDNILQSHKFTNAYRASDRVSQYLIGRIIPGCEKDPRDIFYRIMLFKIFNKIETWEYLEKILGPLHWDFPSTRALGPIDQALLTLRQQKVAYFSGAYIMPHGGMSVKHQSWLTVLSTMMLKNLPERIQDATSLEEVFKILRGWPWLGDFLAFQYTVDLNYSNLIDFDENDFVVAGPGALSGIKKCFEDTGGYSAEAIIKMMTDEQNLHFQRLGLSWIPLWGRPLKQIDCQNLFCETDKYLRLAMPDVSGIGDRTKIKQVFSSEGARPLPIPTYPPKWNLGTSP